MKIFITLLVLLLSSGVHATTKDELIALVERYYVLEAEENYQAVSKLFKPGAEVSYSLDFGMLMPDYNFEFIVNNAASFDVLTEGEERDDSEISNIQWDIADAEISADSGKVVVKLSWDYKSSDGDGSVEAEDTFNFTIVDGKALINSYHSEQEY